MLVLAAPAAARADEPCAASASAEPRAWPAPLDRALAFRARDLALREALDRLSASAHIRISYSAELLPLERRVCVSAGARTVGDALAELLRDTPVEPVVAGPDHVVLALRRARQASAAPPAELSHTVALDRIVVTGSAGGGPRSALPFALDVIDPRQMEREGTSPLSRFLTTAAAGPWAWEQSPSALIARYGSIRGASSFGASTPKVFVDGIEVANPLLVTQIAPESIERIEVIRGPQGAALYGTDAINGVVNIVTRHEGTEGGAPTVRLRTGVGMANSDFASGRAVAQEHAVSLRAGSAVRSAGLDVGVGGVGEYVPDGGSRYVLATGNARRVGARSVLTGTARAYAAGAGPAENPLLRDVPVSAADSAGRQWMRQYTLGGSLRLTPDAIWTHTFIAGIDGGRVAGPLEAFASVQEAEAGPRWSEGGADRLTLRWSSVARLYDGARTDFAATLAAEHSNLREQIAADPGLGIYGTARVTSASGQPYVLWTRSTGLVAQANTTLDDRLHLTAGVRLERNEGLRDQARHAWLPVLGAAWLTPVGDDATLKLRAAFGRGIRPVRTPIGTTAWTGADAPPRGYGLAPEEQEGVEAGFDLAIGRVLQLRATVFDQLASGLIQRVALPVERSGGEWRTAFMLQNVGEISNQGWEVQGSALLGRFSLDGAFSRVDSRVRQVANGYTGDLRRGDRMLEVPARTLSLTGAWAGDGWSASLTGYRAFDWINYDRLALARDLAAGGEGTLAIAGAGLRDYWMKYPGVTHLNAAATLDVRGGWLLVLSGDNLLDNQRGEPDNATVVPGRTLTLGLRAAF